MSTPSLSQGDRPAVATPVTPNPPAAQLSVGLSRDRGIDETAADSENVLDPSDDDQPAEKTRPNKAAVRRVADQDQFDQWIRQKQEVLNDLSSKSLSGWPTSDVPNAEPGRDPAQKRIISSPREYQAELFERAKKKNTIVVLPTGTGKTLIAALLIRHTIEQELIERSTNDKSLEPRIAFFLVDKVSLVYQQWKVLRANLSYNVAKFHGEVLGSMATPSFWKEQVESNMAIVCTADILRKCLSHGYIKIGQINLLVFDEAHHTKKNHPYARIIKDFYVDLEVANCRRPRILGITASPVDAKADMEVSAAQLEGLLHSEIATVDEPALLKAGQVGIAHDQAVEYALPADPWETPLWGRLNQILGENKVFRRLLVFSRELTRELGSWCADRVWHLCLTPEEALKAKAKTEQGLRTRGETTISIIDAKVFAVDDAYQEVARHKGSFRPADLSSGLLSRKGVVLVNLLKQHFRPSVDKGIIFVQQRLMAIIVADLLQQPGLELYGIRPGILLGSDTGNTGEQMSMSHSEQQEAVRKFHRGELNILVSTAIAEEGLDIPDCNMVIRFDLYHTLIQYIQSKGRARMRDSKYFHMVEIGNMEQVQRVLDVQGKEAALRDFCSTLPENRILRGSDFNMEFFLRHDKTKRTYSVPSTGAKLTYESSLVVLDSFTASLATRADVALNPDYMVMSQGSEFQCEIILPENSPVINHVGRRERSKQVAKCSAAYELCVKLHKGGHLDNYLHSVHRRALPAMRNAQLALSSKKRAEYPMKIKPDIWDHRGFPTQLYMTVLRLESPQALGRHSRPLAMLTRTPLPRVSRFPIFFEGGKSSLVECLPLSSGMTISSEQVGSLTAFTLRIFKDVFSKEYKSEPEKLPYYFAPIDKDHGHNFGGHDDDVSAVIEWEYLARIQDMGDLEWEGKPADYLKNRYVTDPHDGSRKFYTTRPRDDLKPSDPQLPNVRGTGNSRARRDALKDIWNYSVSLWSKSRTRIEVRDDLPVIEAEYIPLRRNLLDEFEQCHAEDKRCYICLATLKVSALPIDIVVMAYTIPAIIHRLDSNLIVLEACQGLDLPIRPDLALEAMTKDSDNTDEHDVEQINFQGGMGNNYERLEFLGDSFLKMSTSIALYSLVPEGNEFDYHVSRMILICNKNLFNNALELKLEESVRSKSFNRRVWYPEGLEQLRGKKNTSILGRKAAGRGVHVLGDKSIADVCEALIGAAYLTGKESGSLDMAVQAVTKLSNHKLENEHHTMKTWNELYSAFQVPKWQAAESTAVHVHLAQQIEEQMGYKFTHPRLLRCAFVHPSYSFMYEHIPNYQRLEFLGDALLDMAVVDYLFHRFPGADPQWLTEHKMAMVSNQFLGCLCVALGFQRHMISMAGGLQQQVASYVEALTRARERAEDEAAAAQRARSAYSRDFWTRVAEPPKSLPDVVEAYVGALFVDSGYDYAQVERFFRAHVLPYFEDMRLYDAFAGRHPVAALADRLHHRFGCARWRVMAREVYASAEAAGEGDGTQAGHHHHHDGNVIVGGAGAGCVTDKQVVGVVMVHGAVRAHAMAASGRYAKAAAARRMLAALEDDAGMGVAEFRRAYGCDCTPEDVANADPAAHATAA